MLSIQTLVSSFNDFLFSYFVLQESTWQTVESLQQAWVESAQTESQVSFTTSTTTESTVSVWLFAALLPHDAKDTATNAANKNTNFFIFFVFKVYNTLFL